MSLAFKFYFFAILGLFIALFLWLAAWPANAQQLCGPRPEVIAAIKKSAGEREVWFGKHPNEKGTVMLLLSGKSGSWTLLMVKPDMACIIAAGQGPTEMFGEPT
jgi:hypothetical protein